MHKPMMALGFFISASVVTLSGAASAQGFGQVAIGAAPADPSAAPAAAKPIANSVDGVTVNGKRIPDSQKDPTEVLCHNELPMGSRFPVKVCAQRREYAERRMIDQMEVRKYTALRPGSGN